MEQRMIKYTIRISYVKIGYFLNLSMAYPHAMDILSGKKMTFIILLKSYSRKVELILQWEGTLLKVAYVYLDTI